MTPDEEREVKVQEKVGYDPFKIYSLVDLLNIEFPPKEPLINGIANVGDSIILCGTPKAGKSILMQQITASLSIGEPFLGTLEINRANKVMIVQMEGELSDTHDRFKRLNNAIKFNAENISVFFSGPMELDSIDFTMNLIYKLEKAMPKIDVLIFDPLYLMFSGGSLSDDTAIRKVIGSLRIIKTYFGCTLFVAHHTHKIKRDKEGNIISEGDEAMFGSQFLKAWPDHVMMLSYDQRNGTRVLACTTQRSGTVEKEIKLKLNEPDPLFFEEFIEYQQGMVLEFSQKRILEIMNNFKRPLTAKEIYKPLNMPRSTFYGIIHSLMADQKIGKIKGAYFVA